MRPPAPAQSRRPAAGYAGVSGQPTGGTWRVAAFAAAVASPPWVQRPLRGGAGPPSLWPASGRLRAGGGGGRRGEGSGGGGFSRCPPLAPWPRPPTAAEGRPGGSGPGGPAADWGGRALPSPPPNPWVPDPRAGPRSGPLLSPPSPRGAGWPGGGGGRADVCWGRLSGSAIGG